MKYSSDTRRKLIIAVIQTFLFNFSTTTGTIDASVDYQVEGDGFHRTIRYNVELGNFFKEGCYIALRLSPDPTLYVNIDELSDLRRRAKTTTCSDGETDVELFAENAKRQNITVCWPLGEAGNGVPIHQRYRLPRQNKKYADVTLAPPPLLLLGCKERIREHSVSKIDLCSPCVDLSLKWRQIPYKLKRKNYTWIVPVGDLSDLDYVTNATLVAVCFGTIIILRALWSSRADDKGEKRN